MTSAGPGDGRLLMPLAGAPDVLVDVADTLARVAGQLDGFRRDVGTPVRAAFDGWRGTAAPVAVARLDQDLDALTRAADACRLVAPALQAFAEELRRAQRDAADGETLTAPGAPPADAEVGARIVQSALDGLGFAAEDTARVVREAASLLPAAAPVDVEGGTALDGLGKAGGDLVDELSSTLRGAFDRVNVFSDRFGEAWSETGATISTIATDPMAALDAVGGSISAPIAESYRTGGVDEATGRGIGTIAAALLGGKGLTKLGKLVPDAPSAPSGVHPPEFARPQTRLVPGGGLQRHEELGGHTLAPGKAHVDATAQQMVDRLGADRRLRRVSSFFDRATAENAVAENIRRNGSEIESWLDRAAPNEKRSFQWDHREAVGRTAERGNTPVDVTDERRSTVVLRKDQRVPDGYYVLTSHPGD